MVGAQEMHVSLKDGLRSSQVNVSQLDDYPLLSRSLKSNLTFHLFLVNMYVLTTFLSEPKHTSLRSMGNKGDEALLFFSGSFLTQEDNNGDNWLSGSRLLTA